MKSTDIDYLAEQYLAGVPLQKLEKETGVSRATIRRWLADRGIKLRSIAESGALRRKPVVVDDLVPRYEAGETLTALSKERGLSAPRLAERFRELGVRLRTDAEVKALYRKTPADLSDIIRRYHGGESAEAIGKSVGVTGGTIIRWLFEVDVGIRGQEEAAVARRIKIPIEELRRMYVDEGLSENYVALFFGVSRAVIRSRLQIAGIPVRDQSAAERAKWTLMTPAQRAAQVRAAHEAAAGRWEEEIAYALGLAGLKPDRQVACGSYQLDIAVHKPAVAIEVESHYGFTLKMRAKRLKHILDAGWAVLYVHTRRNFTLPLVCDKILAFVDLARRDKTVFGKYGVIDGKGNPGATRSKNLDRGARVPGF